MSETHKQRHYRMLKEAQELAAGKAEAEKSKDAVIAELQRKLQEQATPTMSVDTEIGQLEQRIAQLKSTLAK